MIVTAARYGLDLVCTERWELNKLIHKRLEDDSEYKSAVDNYYYAELKRNPANENYNKDQSFR